MSEIGDSVRIVARPTRRGATRRLGEAPANLGRLWAGTDAGVLEICRLQFADSPFNFLPPTDFAISADCRSQIHASTSRPHSFCHLCSLQIADSRFNFSPPLVLPSLQIADCRFTFQEIGAQLILPSLQIPPCRFTFQEIGTRREGVEPASSPCRSTLQDFGARDRVEQGAQPR